VSEPSAPRDRPQRVNRRDLSTALLTEVMDRPLDPGYAAAAARRAAGGGTPAPRARWVGAVAAVAIGVLLATAGVRAAVDAPDADRGRVELLDRVQAGTARADDLAARAAALRAENSRLGADLGGAPVAAADATAARLAVAASAVPVRGPGLQVVLADAATEAGDTPTTSGRVVDRDVQLVVNGLWLAGAEAAQRAVLDPGRRRGRPGRLPAADPAVHDRGRRGPDDDADRAGRLGGGPLPAGPAGQLRHRRPDRHRGRARPARRVAPGPAQRERGVAFRAVIAAVGLVIGIVAGVLLHPEVPVFLQPYLPIAVVAALDAVFGGVRAVLDGIFDDKVFVVSFLSNAVVAAFIVYLGDQLGVGSQLSTGVVVVLGVRIFSNAAAIRRHLLKA